MPKALKIQKIEGGKPGQVYYPLELVELPRPTPGPKQLVVRIEAASLNHRDLFIRQHLYPGISFDTPLLADGYGVVVEAGPQSSRADLVGKPVLVNPAWGWASDPDGPEDYWRFGAIGGNVQYDAGMAQEFVAVPEEEVVAAPAHLAPAEGAALPLVGLTAWRALAVKSGNALPGRNLLVTGIGGGVALSALQFAVAKGCNVWVTSSDAGKIERARKLGARGGVSYRDADWEKQLQAMLPEDRPYLDAVIDGAGGDIVRKATRLLRAGGVISCYGMTVAPKMDWGMPSVLKNIELKGSTMGSRVDFLEMVEFVREKKIRPVVSRVVNGLGNLAEIDALFDEMKAGKQFGKLVIQIGSTGNEPVSKL